LLQAAKKGHLKVVRLLLAHGANVNFHDVTGYSAIIASAGRGDIQMTRLLLARGANVNDDWRFGSPLSCAVGRGRLPLVKLLVQAGADVNGGGAYTSVLQDAAAKAYVAVTGYLLRHGAKINNSMRWNRTPLLEATNTHNTAVVALLLRHGADTKERCEAVGMGFETGETALHLAKRKKYFDIVRLLRKASAK